MNDSERPRPEPSLEDEEPLLRIVARRAVKRARIEAATPEFGRLLLFQSSGAAGDALIAIALAGSLFFSVPEADARGRVALYLLVTVAPFAVVAPFLSRLLDRHGGSLRAAIVVTSLGRGILAWLLASRLDTLLLFPIAFGVLVLSRTALVVRGAILPNVLPEGRTLVHANASLSKAAAVAGIAAGLPGLVLIKWPGVRTELLFAALIFLAGALPALRLPAQRGRRELDDRLDARRGVFVLSVRQALFAIGAMRLLVGYLVVHLAFALRRDVESSLSLGVLVGSAVFGGLVGALVAPRLRKRLKEEGIMVTALVVAGISGVVVGRWFSIASAAVLVFAFGVAQGAAKVAFDSTVQRDIPEAARGWAFARFEATLQLLWVLGALVPLALTIGAGTGVTACGLIASAAAVVYMVARTKVRRSPLP